ncbi:DUF563 domain-containing protein [Mucilaginibacter sp. Mucisp86]|uniref:glycosyltransferase family 61 protein n=1 Tax=Mucilaginibacter sp. Mucisp86 TaxID=3243060 RepID=UPI0039B43297
MPECIVLSLPRNVQEGEKHLFASFLSFKTPQIKVKNLKNVFVTNSGFCLNDSGLVKESHHAYPAHLDKYLKEASFYYYDALDNPDKLVYLESEDRFLMIHHPWFMYYHWLCESIFRLWAVKDNLSQLILLLPEEYAGIDFVNKTLLPFGIGKIFYIPKGKSLMVRNLCLPQIKPFIESYDYKLLLQVRDFYLNYVTSNYTYNFNLGDRLYISREKAARKKIINEPELVPVLERYGFKVIYNEDYDFFEQVAIYSRAKCVISIHGSGLTNMLFMPPGGVVFEFQKRLTNSRDWHSVAFWSLSEVLKHHYYHQICEPSDIQADYFTANYVVDINLFEKNMELLALDLK